MIDSGIYMNLIHILVVVPLLAYIGYWQLNTPQRAFQLLMLLGAVMVIYDAYGYFGPLRGSWMNFIHMALGIVLLYLGYMGPRMSSTGYTVLNVLAVVTLLWNIVQIYQKNSGKTLIDINIRNPVV